MIRVPVQIRYNDFDLRGHVNNALYLTYFELARMAAWERIAGPVDAGFILAEARVTYLSPAMLGDALAVEVVTREVRTKAWVWSYRIVAEGDGRVVAEGETTQVMFDYEERRTIAVPAGLRVRLLEI